MATTRGNVDTIDQTQIRLLSGGSAATKLLTTDGSSLTTGNLLKTDASGNVIDSGVVASGVGSGSVTSVGMTVPSRQTVSGSPVTGAGTLAITDNSQSANRVFAGPTSGGSAAPTFRALVTADLPAGVTGKYTTSWTSQTSVTVTHSLGTSAVIVQVFDGSAVLVSPESVTITSSSVVTLTFGSAFTGSVVVIG